MKIQRMIQSIDNIYQLCTCLYWLWKRRTSIFISKTSTIMYKQIQARAFEEFNNWYDVLKFNINSVFRGDPAGYELVARTRWMLLKSSIHRLSLVTYHEMVSFCPKSKRSNTFFMGIIWQTENNTENKKVQVLSMIDYSGWTKIQCIRF